MPLDRKLKSELNRQGADFVRFVDISKLAIEQNKQYPTAILIGITLSPEYLQRVRNTPDFNQNRIRLGTINEDEFHIIEKHTDQLADYTADYLCSKGYDAYSQSEQHIYSTGYYNEKKKSTPLPHKTIAGYAGLGWIGKHNLLVNTEFGSAFSMCSTLTDAPLKTVLHTPSKSQCGDCSVCEEICMLNAIRGNSWNLDTARDELVDVYTCNSCLQCLAHCPYTQKYIQRSLAK